MDSKKRSIVKSVGWETSMFVLATIIFYLYLKKLSDAVILNIIIYIIKVVLLFLWERGWNKINWGKNES